MRNVFRVASMLFIFAMLASCAADLQAQKVVKPKSQAAISKFRLDKAADAYTGTLYATIRGKETKIDEAVIDAWLIDGKRKLLYSKRDGSGGYENEGESLRVYDPQPGRTKKVMSEYYAIADVSEVKTASGRIALIVKMTDGGLGAQYLAVVDPLRGEVFFRKWATLLSRRGDIIRVGFYREDDDWTAFYENRGAQVRPYKTESYNLSAILKRPVIVNKRTQP